MACSIKRFRGTGLTGIYAVLYIYIYIYISFYISRLFHSMYWYRYDRRPRYKEQKTDLPTTIFFKSPDSQLITLLFKVQVLKETTKEQLWPYNSTCTKERNLGQICSGHCLHM